VSTLLGVSKPKRKPKSPCRFPGCPAVTQSKHGYCVEHKKLTDKSYSKERTVHKLYYTKRWQKLRRLVLSSQPFCADPHEHHRRYGDGRVIATEVDHRDGDPDNNFWEQGHPQSNLQGLCKQCHSRKTALEQNRWGRRGEVYTAPYSTGSGDDHTGTKAREG